MAPARPGLFDFDDTLPARIVLLDTDLVHPASGVDGFHPCGVEALADIVPFNEAQLESLRLQLGKSKDGTKGQIRKWVFRKFITFSAETGLYTKTEEYLTGSGTSDGIARNGGKSGGSRRKKEEADDGQKEMAADAKKKKGKGI